MFTLLLLSAAIAQPTGAPLWRDIKAGMPETTLRELYPDKDGSVIYHKGWAILKDALVIGDCHPSVEVIFKKGTVTEVGLWSRPRGVLRHTCGDEIQIGLTGKYGQPATQATDTQPAPGAPIKSAHYTWQANGTVVDLTRDNVDASDTWHVRYTAAANADL